MSINKAKYVYLNREQTGEQLVKILKQRDAILKSSKDQLNKKDKALKEQSKTLKALRENNDDLQEQLKYYRSLKAVGNVYNKTKDTKLKTFRELIRDNIKPEEESILDFSLKDTKTGGQFRSRETKLALSHYLTLSKRLACQHQKDFKKPPSRFKGTTKTSEMIKGKSGIYNECPSEYTEIVADYLVEHPISKW